MGDINLNDLKNKTAAQELVQTDPEELRAEAIKEIAEKKEILTLEERKKVEEIKEGINLLDSSQTITFGVGAQKNLSDFSDTILTKIHNKDTGEVGPLLSELMLQVKDLEIEDLETKKGFFDNIPFFSSFGKKMDRFNAKYETVEIQIDRIEDQLDQARLQMMKDIALFDNLYEKNLEYFNNLQLYIIAGEELIEETRNTTIPKLRQEAVSSNDPMSAQLVRDFEDTVNRFEKKVHDLKLSKQMSIQTAPQIKLIQNNDKMLIDKIQTAILNTIPLWKSQIIIAIGLLRQENALKLQKSVNDTTNELLVKNSEKLRTNTIETARESERGIIDMESLKKVNRDLIDTIQETITIQEQGREKRIQAEKELLLMEEELKQSLLSVRRKDQ
ncbi:MAG: toxic anion resistance protein [Gallicola sp.]|uniref:toxic anion resistance protein n=1 Tax=Gallicola sp. Sow4_E12 TaxID=3438785 RepID=UPI0017ABEB57|nr:toxic anion resistance protein [Gallicola sp.]